MRYPKTALPLLAYYVAKETTQDTESSMTEEEIKKLQEEAAAAKAEAAAQAKAAKDAKAAVDAAVAQERARASELEAKLTQIEKERREAELKQMEPNERVTAELREMGTRMERMQQESQRREMALQQEIRATRLVAYQERALRDVGEGVIPELVGGASEEEIDQSIDAARAAYARMASKFKAEAEAEIAKVRANHAAPAPPPNPAYVAPPAAGGFPTPTNPAPGAETPEPEVANMTTEEAVRSGRYGGETRQKILDQLRRNAGAGQAQLGTLPRHLMPRQQPQAHTQMPGGVQQPNGIPTPPVGHPGQAAPQNPR